MSYSPGGLKESDTPWLLRNNSAYHFATFFFSHLPVGLSDLNIFQMSFILLWGGEGA